jgi:hypothetical protein
MKLIYGFLIAMMLSSMALAQPAPPPPGGDGGGGAGGPPPQRGGGDRQGPRGGGMRGDRGPEGGGPGMMGGGGEMGGFGGGMSMDPRMMKYAMLRQYIDAVEGYARLTRDPANSGIAAVVAAADILRPRGTDAVIDYFNKILPEVKTPAVQRAIRLQLVDLYKASGKMDQALEQLKQLMTADTSNEPAAPAPPQPPPGR